MKNSTGIRFLETKRKLFQFQKKLVATITAATMASTTTISPATATMTENLTFIFDSEDYDLPEPNSDFQFNITADAGTVEYECYLFDRADFEFLQTVDYIVNGVIGTPLACVGIVVNVVCLTILLNAKIRKVLFNQVTNGSNWAVAGTQLVERSLPTPEVRGSNPVISNLY